MPIQGRIFTVFMFVSILLLGMGGSPLYALGMPSQILIIRHAEKPATGDNLNERGWQRARALPNLFKGDAPRFALPVAIYAMAQRGQESSARPIQTVTPLSQLFKIPLLTPFTREQVDALALQIRSNHLYDGKVLLICWEHKMIPLIAKALGSNISPSSWDGDTFDRVWKLDFKNGQISHFEDLPQRLLPGDSTF